MSYEIDLSLVNVTHIKFPFRNFIQIKLESSNTTMSFGFRHCFNKAIDLIEKAKLYTNNIIIEYYGGGENTHLLKLFLTNLNVDKLEFLCAKITDFLKIVDYFNLICRVNTLHLYFGSASEVYSGWQGSWGDSEHPNTDDPNYDIFLNQRVIDIVRFLKNCRQISIEGLYYLLKELDTTDMKYEEGYFIND